MMTIDKAIERLQDSLDHNTILITRGDKDALRLGLEALKVVKEFRTGRYKTINSPLLGEAKVEA